MRVIGIAGWSGAGKTTLLTRLIPLLVARGRRVACLKHAHHAFEVDQPGKDSYEQRKAGAQEVIVSSGRRWVQIRELRGAPEATLAGLLARVSPCDLVLVEGFKRMPHRKVEVFRQANGKPPLHPDDPFVVALASDVAFPQAGLARVHLDDVEGVAALVEAHAEPIGDLLARLADHGPAE